MLLFQNIPDYDTTGFHSTTTFIAVHVRVCVCVLSILFTGYYGNLISFPLLPVKFVELYHSLRELSELGDYTR